MRFKESETIELKSTVTDDLKKEILAFANTEGGSIYIGVRDDGVITGLTDADQSALQVSNMIRDAIRPDLSMFVHYETIKTGGKNILAVNIQRGTNRPYYIGKKGLRPEGVYVRQGYSSAPASMDAIRRMIRETDGARFEEMRSLEQDLTFQAADKEFAEENVAFGDVQKTSLGIINRDGIYTNLGLLLSDQCRHTIKAAVFEGNDQSIFRDRREFSGSLFQQMEDVFHYIDFHNQTRSTYNGLKRIDYRDYPEMAVRESLLNALIHREYAVRASTLISMYSNRIEFTSIGGLVEGMTLPDVRMGVSICRNEKLANVFYRLELIEAYGTGIGKIMSSYSGSGMEPQMITSENAFKMILPNRNAGTEDQRMGQLRPSAESAGSGKADEHPANLLSNSDRVLQLADRQVTIRRSDVQDLLGISQTSSGQILRELVKDRKLIKEGGGRSTRYRLP